MERNITAAAALTLSVVALAAPAHAADGGSALDLKGKDLPVAKTLKSLKTLDTLERVDLKEVSGQNGSMIWPPAWKLCLQQPAPGTPQQIQQLKFAVVKRAQRCP
ncbi:hypothetical protein [Streptomyces sp. XD-27]|uniref:hypothetical protein n=1 Tax=Streptomyces sp. XD-27 TaxID=3062779 RepID=UPI0026F43619|nr:hypothetical protein [Streptomyces sp. XD-27]WKX69181.1 hypothetical protein Q3Y56_03915 [Streptomyces sp. XD-27]